MVKTKVKIDRTGTAFGLNGTVALDNVGRSMLVVGTDDAD